MAPNGPSAWTVGLVGTKTQQFRRVSLTKDQLATLTFLSPSCSYDGDAGRLKLGLQSEVGRGPDFLRLANALSALYPTDSEEKRLRDAMLLAVPRG